MAAKKDTFLRDAIRDAKAVREMAISNARITIEEAIQPQVSSMIAKKLREAEEPKSADGYGSAEGGKTDKEAVMENENPGSSEIGTSNNKEPSKDSDDSSNIGTGGKHTVDLSEDAGNANAHYTDATDSKDSEHVVDLSESDDTESETMDEEASSFIDEDINDILSELDLDDEENDDVDIDIDVPADTADEPEGDSVNLDVHGGEGMHDMDSDHDLHGELDDKHADVDVNIDADGDEDSNDFDLDEILKEIEAADEHDVSPAAVDRYKYPNIAVHERKISELENSIKEHREVITYLKERLQEVNMLNSKLLYANKLFKAYNLTLEQKRRVVETLDRAKTLHEAKLVYVTMAQSLNESVRSISKKKVKNIVEGIASKATGKLLTESKKSDDNVLDPDVVARLQKLARVKSNKTI